MLRPISKVSKRRRDEDREKCESLMDWTASQKAKNYQHSAVAAKLSTASLMSERWQPD